MSNIISLFSGCGGLDLGFIQAGFNVVLANDNSKHVVSTYTTNHPIIPLDTRNITEISFKKYKYKVIGIIGSPPCQSWSVAGKGKGIEDPRGRLFYEFVRAIDEVRPVFFVTENVSGLVTNRHRKEFLDLLTVFANLGYSISYQVLDASCYEVPQTRKRLFIVGYRSDIDKQFIFPSPSKNLPTLHLAIGYLKHQDPIPTKGVLQAHHPTVKNHEFLDSDFSPFYMTSQRVRSWNEPSYTISATARSIALHPQANKMVRLDNGNFAFDTQTKKPYRRLSVRECADIQTFPKNFLFDYSNVKYGYRMVGNAVPVKLSHIIANTIFDDLVRIK